MDQNEVVQGQNPFSEVDGLEFSVGGSWPLTEASECAVTVSGGGDKGLPS
jgi:hypothetical protein